MSSTFRIEVVPTEPIIIGHLSPDFKMSTDAKEYVTELRSILENAAPGSYYITEASKINLSFGDMISGMALFTRGEMDITALLRRHHILAVVQNKLIELGASALGQPQYGGLKPQIYPSLEAALAAARAQIAA
jgi:hypothetical protein